MPEVYGSVDIVVNVAGARLCPIDKIEELWDKVTELNRRAL